MKPSRLDPAGRGCVEIRAVDIDAPRPALPEGLTDMAQHVHVISLTARRRQGDAMRDQLARPGHGEKIGPHYIAPAGMGETDRHAIAGTDPKLRAPLQILLCVPPDIAAVFAQNRAQSGAYLIPGLVALNDKPVRQVRIGLRRLGPGHGEKQAVLTQNQVTHRIDRQRQSGARSAPRPSMFQKLNPVKQSTDPLNLAPRQPADSCPASTCAIRDMSDSVSC